MSSISEHELDAFAFELVAVRDRTHGSGVLVQEIDLFERQSLCLKRVISLLEDFRERAER